MWRDHSQGLLLFKMDSVSKASFFPLSYFAASLLMLILNLTRRLFVRSAPCQLSERARRPSPVPPPRFCQGPV